MINEVITCIKLIKMYGWEKSFAKVVRGTYVRSCGGKSYTTFFLPSNSNLPPDGCFY